MRRPAMLKKHLVPATRRPFWPAGKEEGAWVASSRQRQTDTQMPLDYIAQPPSLEQEPNRQSQRGNARVSMGRWLTSTLEGVDAAGLRVTSQRKYAPSSRLGKSQRDLFLIAQQRADCKDSLANSIGCLIEHVDNRLIWRHPMRSHVRHAR